MTCRDAVDGRGPGAFRARRAYRARLAFHRPRHRRRRSLAGVLNWAFTIGFAVAAVFWLYRFFAGRPGSGKPRSGRAVPVRHGDRNGHHVRRDALRLRQPSRRWAAGVRAGARG